MMFVCKIIKGDQDEEPLVREVSKWMLSAYILWSICADIALLSGILYLIFF